MKASTEVIQKELNTDSHYAVNYTCHELEQAIDPKAFFRINPKVLVQISATQKIRTYFNSRLKITCYGLNDEDCIVSRESVKDFKPWLDA